MSDNKLNRRIKYTRMVLKESLMELLKEKPISSITVKEICERADINRSTFYSHYSDQFALLSQIEEEFLSDMNETLNSYNFQKDEEALQMTERLLEYVAANKDVCEVLLGEHADATFQKRVMTFAHNYVVKNLIRSNDIEPDISEYVSLFAISGSIYVIQHWLKRGMDKSPKEMSEIINRITKSGISGF
ncbi:TetR/AcrR family transcriptional regulator [Litchfieldia alkalitelluris]|uniref:TetR/AcrR family transcriptional regulator n=1 Tax=Litchfieldia alkalitelluris TaxID=304268 RepID=UPI000996FFCB|nr:TetR/AcrR family transcriptional regulator [Litchfieldia alkalitelluris]